MVSNSKKYFTALFVRTALKTNTKCFHPTEIPVFRKSISGTCIPHVQTKESKKLDTKLIMEAQLPSYSSLTVSHSVFVLFPCCALRGIPWPSRKWVCLVYFVLSSSAAFVELTGDCLKSQNLNSIARADFVLRDRPECLHTQTDGPVS